ncbi:plasmid mobilization protein [Pseudomonas caricapapayae]|uniref:plasmid mobilization protein n=1 Tax=Pseudomonas caricapapayae TaxID=46678 RepID=UPI0037C6106A
MNEQRRTKWLPSVRCFEHEETAVREKAYDCGKSTGQFMLAAALGRRTQSKIDSHILNKFRRLAGLQNICSRKAEACIHKNMQRSLLR